MSEIIKTSLGPNPSFCPGGLIEGEKALPDYLEDGENGSYFCQVSGLD